MTNDALTVRELSRRWRCRAGTVRMMVRQGVLPAFRLGRGIRIAPEAIRAAETGPLAVRPRRRRHPERIDADIVALLE
jgi:excisionase family DNA binding protein